MHTEHNNILCSVSRIDTSLGLEWLRYWLRTYVVS